MTKFQLGYSKSNDKRTDNTMEPIEGAPELHIPAKIWEYL